MRHHRIPKSSKHKKFKHYKSLESDDDEETGVPLDKRKLRKAQQKVDKLKEQKAPRKMMAITSTGGSTHDPVPKKNRTPALLRIAATVDGDDTGCTRGLKPMPPFLEKGPYESEDQFLNRISRLSSQAMTEAKLEERFGLDFCPVLQPQMMSTRSGKVVPVRKKRKKKRNGPTIEERAENRRAKRRERDAKRRCKKREAANLINRTDLNSSVTTSGSETLSQSHPLSRSADIECEEL